ncbi:MAG: TonB-dependent receptor [Bacteroidota bacterium]
MNKTRIILLFFCCNLLISLLHAQQLTQIVRGTVMDKESKQVLPGAAVLLVNSSPLIGVTTDINGKFRLEKVPVGRRSFKVSYIGYEDYFIKEIEIISSKETILNVELNPKAILQKTVEIKSKTDKSSTQNEMSVVSARGFTVEETSKYAGCWGDPSRMASFFAGVVHASDKRNDIVVRGNSPIGVLWRLDGMDIPNPNHFAIAGSSGGAISMINNNLLENSDFLSGAYPAEYGNANSAVFDLKLRNGNNEKHEYIAQLGVNGLEAGMEGPFSKKHRASYLINFRYSTLALLDLAGIRLSDGVPQFYDLSMKLHFPTKKGSISFVGIGGRSSSEENPEHDSGKWTKKSDAFGYSTGSQMGFAALQWIESVSKDAYFKTSLSYSVFNPFNIEDSLDVQYHSFRMNEMHSLENHLGLDVFFLEKINAKFSLQTGVNFKNISTQNSYKEFIYDTLQHQNNINLSNGATQLVQVFVQSKYFITEKFLVLPGIHLMYLLLNYQTAVEPRLQMKWMFSPRHALSFAFGVHHMMQPLSIYFSKQYNSNGEAYFPNKNLDFSRSFQYVLGYDWNLNEYLRLKTEIYYQDISQIPLSAQNPSMSLVNFGTDDNIFSSESYVSKGKAYNYGLELTLEKYFSNSWYAMLSGSLFQSKYFDFNSTLHNTRFNGNYALNVLAGYEFKTGSNSLIGINMTLSLLGGQHFTPIDLEKSKAEGKTVFVDSLAYTGQYGAFFKTDFRLRYRLNRKRCAHEIAFELANIFNYQNIENQYYNPDTQELNYNYQLGRIPIVTYRIEF